MAEECGYNCGLSVGKIGNVYPPVSHRFNGYFPGGPGLAGTRMSPFSILLELRMMGVVVTTGATRCATQNSSQIVTTNKPTPNYLKGSVKEPNNFHNYETEKITRKASDVAEYIELFGSFSRDRHA